MNNVNNEKIAQPASTKPKKAAKIKKPRDNSQWLKKLKISRLIGASTLITMLYAVVWLVYMVICSVNSGSVFASYNADCMTVACGAWQADGIAFALLPIWLVGLILSIPIFVLDLLALLKLEDELAAERRRVEIVCGCQAVMAVVLVLCAFLDLRSFLLAYWLQTVMLLVGSVIMGLVVFLRSRKKQTASNA